MSDRVFHAGEQELESGKRVRDFISEIAGEAIQKRGRSPLRRCLKVLFTPDLPYAAIGSLSGGEKRSSIFEHLIAAPNILLLDEPTNDLDIETRRSLRIIWNRSPGAVITASHDRYFDKTALIFEVKDGGKITLIRELF